MRQVRLGQTNLQVSMIAFGTWVYGGDWGAANVDVAITMVANPQALEQVVLGEDGLAGGLGRGQLLMDMSAVGPEAVREVAAGLPHGVRMVDAPVRGSVPEATAGRLAIYVGADQPVFERVEPILAVLGTPHRVGGLGAGAAAKVVNNSTLGAAIVAFGEALALGDTLGLERSALLDVLADSPIGSTVRASVPTSNPAATRPPSSCAWRSRTFAWSTRSSRDWLERAANSCSGDLDDSAVIAAITDGGRSPA
jgi:3-hydroxyisobutyrate dehydrogenase-like beta-hydroxyacid dehydrogenase